jgi:hypothetical protein
MIFIQLTDQLQSLGNLLILLNDREYTHSNRFLGDASVGGHTRHIIELLKCAVEGYNTGNIDYFNRARNLSLESDKFIALQELRMLERQIIKADKDLKLSLEGPVSPFYIRTTYYREIAYNTEHTIHHLALIRVALREMNLDIVGDDFGVAPSTTRYRHTQLQAY